MPESLSRPLIDAEVAALSNIRGLRVFDLETVRFPGMPQYAGHFPFTVLTYRSPRGIQQAGDEAWLADGNEVNFNFTSEVISCTVHTGAHVDAPAHATIGPDDHWHGGGNAADHLGDFGPQHGDAATLPVMIGRGILVDIAAHLGRDRLPGGYAISLDEFDGALRAQGLSIQSHDVVLVRTGQMSAWPDGDEMDKTFGAGITLEVAEYCMSRGASALGSDSAAVEVMPSVRPGHPHPVHELVLIELGRQIMENLYLEDLHEAQVSEFVFFCAPLKIRGATGAMIRPIAIA
ncbi:MAG: cyclase family protein [Nocardioides sp.]|uniref:cyclase family protein n=1 Tax=Nocardioides sp. TaxID=35761 RepID=UPI0039E46E88